MHKGIKIALGVSLGFYGVHTLIVSSQAERFVKDGLLKDHICSQVMIAEALTPHMVDRVIDAAMVNNSYIFDFLPIGIPYIDFVIKF